MPRKGPTKIPEGIIERMDEATATLIWLRSELAGHARRDEPVPVVKIARLVAITDETLKVLGRFDASTEQPPAPE